VPPQIAVQEDAVHEQRRRPLAVLDISHLTDARHHALLVPRHGNHLQI